MILVIFLFELTGCVAGGNGGSQTFCVTWVDKVTIFVTNEFFALPQWVAERSALF
jgi:hypothetical protein